MNRAAAVPETDTMRPDAQAPEFRLNSRQLRQIAEILHKETGIYLPESKSQLVQSRLAKRLRVLNLGGFEEYCALITGPSGSDERRNMMASLTTNVTRFFREPHHFEHLKTKVLPPLLSAAKTGARVRIWSAACSNGQEPYSIALTILSLMPDAANYDVRILATDIDPNMVRDAKNGLYTERSVANVPDELRKRHFSRCDDGSSSDWRIQSDPRALITFRELNLMDRWPFKGPFQAIFCRNVVIYFKEETQQKIWSRFAPLLAPDGLLYIGHSERVTGMAASVFDTAGVTTYQRRPI